MPEPSIRAARSERNRHERVELSLVADHVGRVVGHVLLSYVSLDARRVRRLGQGRVAFPPAFAV